MGVAYSSAPVRVWLCLFFLGPGRQAGLAAPSPHNRQPVPAGWMRKGGLQTGTDLL